MKASAVIRRLAEGVAAKDVIDSFGSGKPSTTEVEDLKTMLVGAEILAICQQCESLEERLSQARKLLSSFS